jgi:hypothetical protein
MPGFVLSYVALRLLSLILGGYGIFCLTMSFIVPRLGGKASLLLCACLLLGTATAIAYFSDTTRAPR